LLSSIPYAAVSVVSKVLATLRLTYPQQSTTLINGMSPSRHLDPLRLPQPSELEKWSEKISSGFNNLVQLVNAIRQPVPDQTDGGKPLDPVEEEYWVKKIEGDLKDVAHLRIPDVKALVEISEKMKRGEPLDDRQYLMEGLIKVSDFKMIWMERWD
jgi:hypothetical protein